MFKDKLIDDSLWDSYRELKITKDFISDKEKKELEDFVVNRKYKKITKEISLGKYHFSTPIKHLVNKSYGKKRIVYTYTDIEMQILKYISYLLYDYDYLFSKNLYSFRKNISVKNAIKSLEITKNIKNMYGYKVDIKNYFNSINTNILINNLKEDIKDKDLYSLLEELLTNPYTIYQNEKILEDKGVIAGSPTSAFLANYYLKEVDQYFWGQKVFYIRYADDILIFANSIDELRKYREKLYAFLNEYKLEINHNKEHFYNPGESFEFLGFLFSNNKIDLSTNTVYKIKGKIRGTSRGLRRWLVKNKKDERLALKAMIRKYNRKFFGTSDSQLTWKFWFFPSINTDKSLKLIDKYYQEQLRYLATGKHNKKNYKIVPYSTLKDCGYQSLVHEYYKFKI